MARLRVIPDGTLLAHEFESVPFQQPDQFTELHQAPQPLQDETVLLHSGMDYSKNITIEPGKRSGKPVYAACE
jgi:hypothetical protein